MPCEGNNPNCDRRRELLAQLKCLISSMERKKPCEWDEPPCAPLVCCLTPPCAPAVCCPTPPCAPAVCFRTPPCAPAVCCPTPPCAPTVCFRTPPCAPAVCCPTPPCAPTVCYPTDYTSPCCVPLKPCKSFEFCSSVIQRCICIKRNGLQDKCMMWDCMGRPECMTKLYPVCGPGRAALMKLTDLGDDEVALQKFYCADRAREAALAAYCRLVCNKACQLECSPCINKEALCCPVMPVPKCNIPIVANFNLNNGNKCSVDCSSLYRLSTPPPNVLQCYNVCPPCY